MTLYLLGVPWQCGSWWVWLMGFGGGCVVGGLATHLGVRWIRIERDYQWSQQVLTDRDGSPKM